MYCVVIFFEHSQINQFNSTKVWEQELEKKHEK